MPCCAHFEDGRATCSTRPDGPQGTPKTRTGTLMKPSIENTLGPNGQPGNRQKAPPGLHFSAFL
eukprot:8320550-Pyramimonas_sp.AAC.1